MSVRFVWKSWDLRRGLLGGSEGGVLGCGG